MQSSNTPITGWRHAFWLVLLVAASMTFSLGFACTTPFVAFAVVAALTLSRRDATFLMLAVWLANQLVGYGLLHYPQDAESFTWGAAIGVTVMLTLLAARKTASYLRNGSQPALLVGAFLAAFVVYEGALYLFAMTPLGGTENFTADIVGRIFATNGLALAGLYALNYLGTMAGFAAPAGKHA